MSLFHFLFLGVRLPLSPQSPGFNILLVTGFFPFLSCFVSPASVDAKSDLMALVPPKKRQSFISSFVVRMSFYVVK